MTWCWFMSSPDHFIYGEVAINTDCASDFSLMLFVCHRSSTSLENEVSFKKNKKRATSMDFFGDDEGTTTTSSFLATVTESTPFRFDSIHAQTRSSLRITHISVIDGSGKDNRPTFAQIRTLSAPSAEVTTTTVAGFPATAPNANNKLLVSSTSIASSLNILIDLDGFTELIAQGPGTLLFFGEQSTQLIDENRHHEMFDEEGEEDEEGEDDDDDEEIDFAEMRRLARN